MSMTNTDRPPVVVAVDGQPGSAGALRYAVDEAVRAGESLHLVHVRPGGPAQDLVPTVTWGEREAAGRAVLDHAYASARRLAPGLDITTELAVGPRAAEILSAARGGRLLLVGRTPHRVESPFGGTPAGLAARAAGPVVVVPATWQAAPTSGLVVVGMKTRTHARELLSHAFAVADSRDAALVVVTAWELYDPAMDREEAGEHASEWEAEGRQVLRGIVGEWSDRCPSVPVDLRIVHGRAASVLEHASAEADLLLLAKHQHLVPPYGRLGRTAHALLRTSRCPVEVVPAGVVAELHSRRPALAVRA
jgi:nucleotide-binding universal stress UspA family protein